MSAKAVIGGLVAGFGAYYLIKWIRSKGPISGLSDEAGAYGYLIDVRKQLQDATKLYTDAAKKIEDLDMKLLQANDEYMNAEAEQRPTILFRIAEIQRQRDMAVLEAELVIRNVINPLRETLVTEEARLKSIVMAPNIALNRTGKIPAF